MTDAQSIQLVECPRDAMQGIKTWIPTEDKIRYIQYLLGLGFHTIDFGSFVSPKAVPQMKDSREVYEALELENTQSKLLAIVANERGARDACELPLIDYIGYPFSISETFQMRNTNATIAESLERVKYITDRSLESGKEMVVYISMGFGNPYGDEWSAEIVLKWVDQLHNLGIRIFSLSDTIGVSQPESIRYLFSNLIPVYKDVTFGAHLHTQPFNWREKVAAAYESGCRRFDGAIKGYGGCPMATDHLTGNMPTEHMLSYLREVDPDIGIAPKGMAQAIGLATEVFPVE